MVVAADREWGIGKSNGLPWPKLKGDLAHFKRVTSEAGEGRRNAVIMGRKTWDSAEVAGRALPRRLNVIITRRGLTPPEGVLVVGSLDAALDAAGGAETTFVVGGAEIFREAFAHPQLRYVYLTRVAGAFGCDVHIPDLDALGFTSTEWAGACDAEENGIGYRIERLRPAAVPG